jgi:hypothetical protein
LSDVWGCSYQQNVSGFIPVKIVLIDLLMLNNKFIIMR